MREGLILLQQISPFLWVRFPPVENSCCSFPSLQSIRSKDCISLVSTRSVKCFFCPFTWRAAKHFSLLKTSLGWYPDAYLKPQSLLKRVHDKKKKKKVLGHAESERIAWRPALKSEDISEKLCLQEFAALPKPNLPLLSTSWWLTSLMA